MKFILEVNMGNESMRSREDLMQVFSTLANGHFTTIPHDLEGMAETVSRMDTGMYGSWVVRDVNGNHVGSFHFEKGDNA